MTSRPTYITGLCVAATIVAQASTRSATPGPRIGHGLAFDGARGRTVLFGGFGPDGVPQSDTWEWDGEAWQLSSNDGPSARRWPAMVYDASRGHVILFGGREGVGRGGTSRGDTWEWDGKVWKELRSDDGPSGRDHHAMVYDRARGSVVVFGGWDGEAVVGDTWEWNESGNGSVGTGRRHAPHTQWRMTENGASLFSSVDGRSRCSSTIRGSGTARNGHKWTRTGRPRERSTG